MILDESGPEESKTGCSEIPLPRGPIALSPTMAHDRCIGCAGPDPFGRAAAGRAWALRDPEDGTAWA